MMMQGVVLRSRKVGNLIADGDCFAVNQPPGQLLSHELASLARDPRRIDWNLMLDLSSFGVFGFPAKGLFPLDSPTLLEVGIHTRVGRKVGCIRSFGFPLGVKEFPETFNFSLQAQIGSGQLFNQRVAGSQFSALVLFGHGRNLTPAPKSLKDLVVRDAGSPGTYFKNGHLQLADCRTRHAMLDCPLQIHTPPTTTLLNLRVLLASTVSTCGLALASSASSFTIQLPSLSAVACLIWPAKLTLTSSSGSARPQIGTGMSRCSTMLSPKT